MPSWERPWGLWLAAFTPFIIAFAFAVWLERKRYWNRVKGAFSKKQRIFLGITIPLGSVLLVVSFFSGVMAVAGPRIERMEKYAQESNLLIIVGLDTSLSMLAPIGEGSEMSRLDMAKLEIRNLVSSLSDDRLGLVSLAGTPKLWKPGFLSTDYARFFLRWLNRIDEAYIANLTLQNRGGSNIAAALLAAAEAFPSETQKRKVIFLLSDGEPVGEDEDKMEEDLGKFDEAVRGRDDIAIYLIGIGDPKKELPIPRYDANGNLIGIWLDEAGRQMTTKPDPEYLRGIAERVSGTFIHARTGQELHSVIKKTIAKERVKTRVEKERQVTVNYSQWFIGAFAASLFLLFFLM